MIWKGGITMTNTDYSITLRSKIAEHRRRCNLTQEGLANQLGITFQAVSKWENGVSCPDIFLLPQLAALFQTTIDDLFGIAPAIPNVVSVDTDAAFAPISTPPSMSAHSSDTSCAQSTESIASPDGSPNGFPDGPSNPTAESTQHKGPAGTTSPLPWNDDGVVRITVFQGIRLVKNIESPFADVEIHWYGEVADIESRLSISCDTIYGNARAGVNIRCDEVLGDVTAGCDVHCDSISGDVTAGCDINCDSIDGDAHAGGNITCDSIGGDVTCRGSLTCASIGGNVTHQRS